MLLQLADNALLAMLAFEHGQLPAIDGDRAILPRVVHPQHLVPAFAAEVVMAEPARSPCRRCIGGWLAE